MTRKYSIDILRILSAIAVVIIHVVTAPVNNASAPIAPGLESILHMIHALCYGAVPIFFMITGYCMMLKKECTYRYCFSHVAKFVGVLLTVGLCYALMEEVYAARTLNLAMILRGLRAVLEGKLWDFMWYVYAIIGVYLVMPVLHSFLQKGKKEVLTFTALLFLFTILFPSLSAWFTVGIDFPIGGYLFYICAGGAMARFPVRKSGLWKLICTAVVVLYCVAVFGGYSFSLIWNPYLDPLVCVASVALFFLVSNLDIRGNQAIRTFGACTWGIYLFHPLFLNLILKVLHLDLVSSLAIVKLPLLTLVLLVLSFGLTFILRKIPLVKHLF